MADRVPIAVLGTGRIGRLHAENLTHRVPAAEVVAVADVVEPAAEACAAELGITQIYTDPQRAIEDSGAEAVVICSSTDTHADLIEQAAAAGQHVFCEKPIALDLARIDRALQAVERAGVKLQVGFNRRFDPNFARARQLVAEGEAGRVHLLRITSRDPAPPPLDYVKVSGGLFLDMMIHDFDMARFMVGDEVEELYTAAGVLVDPAIGEAGDVDTAAVTLKFRGGAIGVIDNSRRATYGYDQRVEVFGDRGRVVVGNPRPHTASTSGERGDAGPPLMDFFIERYTQSYVNELNAFIGCLQTDTAPTVTGIDGRVPVVMGHAARRSLEENRPVRLDEIEI